LLLLIATDIVRIKFFDPVTGIRGRAKHDARTHQEICVLSTGMLPKVAVPSFEVQQRQNQGQGSRPTTLGLAPSPPEQETRVTEDTRASQRRSIKQLNMPELLEMGRSGAYLPELTLQPPQARTVRSSI
jgi:hypothetical protein